MLFESFEEVYLGKILLIALYSLLCTVDTSVDHFYIGENEFEIDSFDVAQRIDTSVNVDDIRILKAAYNMNDSIDLTDVSKELISQTFAL